MAYRWTERPGHPVVLEPVVLANTEQAKNTLLFAALAGAALLFAFKFAPGKK